MLLSCSCMFLELGFGVVLNLTWTLLELLCLGVFGPRICSPLFFAAVRAMWLLDVIFVL